MIRHLSEHAWAEVVKAINLLAEIARIEPYNGTSRLNVEDWARALDRAQRLADEADELLQELLAATRDQIGDAGASSVTSGEVGQ